VAVRQEVVATPEQPAELHLAQSSDLGIGGMRLWRRCDVDDPVLPQHTPLRLAFQLPDDGQLLEVAGEVAFERVAQDGSTVRATGVRFDRLPDAVRLRRDIYRLDAVTDSYRVIHAEGDGLSGLIVDRFGDVLVVCFYAAGMWRMQHWVFDALLTQFPDAQIFAFGDDNAQKQEGFDCPPGRPPHGGKPVTITEHDAKFFVQIGGKHKTGFFCDQRDNRKRWGELIAATRSSSMLDLCCNSGGFAVYSGLNGATDITGVDLDEEAVDFATRNLRLNNVKAKVTQADIFPWLREAQEAGKRWDAVVLDPAKMTRSRDEVIDALKKYLDMNKLALGVVKPGGLFLTCSCTGVVSEEQFLDMLRRAAFYAGREVQVLEVRGAGPDHPWLAHVNESRYLKAVFCRVL
jgi:23S rRNA (cytosine1962-C5)-methyltransferase